jgi:tetratricopeptide (TPR) repeat protein
VKRFARIASVVGILAGVGGGAACHRRAHEGGAQASSSSPAVPQSVSPAKAADPIRPPTQAELPTTNGAIAFRNLSAQIEGLEAEVGRGRAGLDLRLALADLVGTRGTYASKIADYERADALTEAAVREAPAKGEAWLARASARATLHRFAEATADLDEAEKRGLDPSRTRATRASILQAQGDLDGAWALRRADTAASRNVRTLGAEAALLGEMRKLDEAHARFVEAAASFRDVSPLPIAWLFVQEGAMWERAGELGRATAYYAAAHERLPAYAHAAVHLASLEHGDRALALLRPVAAASDDPELEVALAQRLREANDAPEADRRLGHARERFEELLRAHPEAFAEHAATFFLDDGHDPKRAFALAKQNLAVRKSDHAYELAALAALAAGEHAEGCALAAQGAARPYASKTLGDIAKTSCGGR